MVARLGRWFTSRLSELQGLGIVAFIALALGALIIVQGHTLLPKFGQGKLLYSILVVVITRELGPLLTAFIIIARSGTAIATELGNMVISHEIEAYVFNFFGLIGSFLLTQLVQATPFREYLENLLTAMTAADIFSSLIKAVVFGFIVSVVAVYQGFKVRLSSTEAGC